jgi:hypothetical protein
MTGGLHIDSYEWPGGREPMLRFGDRSPRVVLALPLLEEFNRTRAFGVTLLRGLAARGVSGLLPDWPGTGESLMPTQAVSLEAMRVAYGAIAASYAPLFALSIRSGALLDTGSPVSGRWHFSPQDGADFAREMGRQTSREGDVAGNLLSDAFREEVGAATTDDARVVRLDSDGRDADLKIAGVPLWRRAEPDNDPALAARLADDIADWIATCGG